MRGKKEVEKLTSGYMVYCDGKYVGDFPTLPLAKSYAGKVSWKQPIPGIWYGGNFTIRKFWNRRYLQSGDFAITAPLSENPSKKGIQKIRHISDDRHGWLEVPVSELEVLGIANQITPYSYRKDDKAYLEEDQDAQTYLDARKATGWTKPEIVNVYQSRCRIRSYPGF